MSTQRRPKRSAPDDARHLADHAATAKGLDGESAPNPPAQDWTEPGKTDPIVTLLPATESWMAMLAVELRPTAICQKLPHIANELAALWTQPDEFASYLSELLVGWREGRRVFPIRVARELHALRAYHVTLHREGAAVRGKPSQP